VCTCRGHWGNKKFSGFLIINDPLQCPPICCIYFLYIYFYVHLKRRKLLAFLAIWFVFIWGSKRNTAYRGEKGDSCVGKVIIYGQWVQGNIFNFRQPPPLLGIFPDPGHEISLAAAVVEDWFCNRVFRQV